MRETFFGVVPSAFVAALVMRGKKRYRLSGPGVTRFGFILSGCGSYAGQPAPGGAHLRRKQVTEIDKRQAILSAAQEIFSEKGLKDSTITEIAQRAGVVDSIIYHYFKNKEDLLFCAFYDTMHRSHEELMFQFKGIMGPVSKLGKMVWYHLYMNDFNTGHARIVKNLLLECRSNKNFYTHESYAALRRYTDVLLGILREGVKEGYFREELNLKLVRDMIFGILDEVSLSCLQAREVTQTTSDFDAIMSLILAMIAKKQPAEPENNNDKALRVLRAATDVFAQKGFNKATMVDVGQKAGVAEGTIYEYYKNKQDLLLSIPKERFQSYRSTLENCFHYDDPTVKLRHFIWIHLGVLLSDPQFLTLFLNDIKLNKQFYVSDSYPFYLQYIQPLFDILNEGKQKSFFRPDVDNRIYRNLFIGSFTQLAIRWFVVGKITPLDMMIEFCQLTDLLCRSIVKE